VVFALILWIETNSEWLLLSYIYTLIQPTLFLTGISLSCEGYFKKHKAQMSYRGRPGKVQISSVRSVSFCASAFQLRSEQRLAEQSSVPAAIVVVLHIPSESWELRGLHCKGCVLNVR